MGLVINTDGAHIDTMPSDCGNDDDDCDAKKCPEPCEADKPKLTDENSVKPEMVESLPCAEKPTACEK